jgi:hypothetical protein
LVAIEEKCLLRFIFNLVKDENGDLFADSHNNSVWNKEELPDQWKESIIIPIHKKCDKTDCNNYRPFITAINFIQNFIKYPPFKVRSAHR